MAFINIFSIHNTILQILNYPLSFIEFLGVTTGLLGLYLATHEKTLNWPINLISMTCFFGIFYQINLYAQMFFQIYFFAIAIYGWIHWQKEEKNHQSSLSYLKKSARLRLGFFIIATTLLLSWLTTRLTIWMPTLFSTPDPYPITDSFIAIGSVTAMTLLAQKKIENWILWITVNGVSVILYAKQGILFASLEYFIFLLMVIIGFFSWKRKHHTMAS